MNGCSDSQTSATWASAKRDDLEAAERRKRSLLRCSFIMLGDFNSAGDFGYVSAICSILCDVDHLV